MFRYDIINSLITKYKFNNYLEIGVRDPNDCFNLINCNIKHSVDPMFERYEESINFKHTSDDFFNLLENNILNLSPDYKWDVIFIDGYHISTQVDKDIKNSLNHLSENGFIILHDCNPPNIFRAREDFVIDGQMLEWNGTVWKAIYKLRATRPDLFICTVDTDEGIGVITRGFQTCCDFDNPFYEYRMFEKNRVEYLNLISVDDFKQTILRQI